MIAVDAKLVDAAPDHTCFGSLAIDRVCFANSVLTALPANGLMVNGDVMINTMTSPYCTATTAVMTNQAVCVVLATSFTLSSSAKIHVTGAKPVIFVATTSAGMNFNSGALLEASSYGPQIGAGALATACVTGTPTVHAGGGFGGSFIALGGAGGKGQFDDSVGAAPPPVVAIPTTLVGGCAGGAGEGNTNPKASGGGAIALISDVIQSDGIVAVGGNGGHGGSENITGGNGGGAGGMIVLDSPSIKGSGAYEARGGGGGQGRGGNAAGDGGAGFTPNGMMESMGGSQGGSMGGIGGAGAPTVDSMTMGGLGLDAADMSAAGGGGGGGASGIIFTSSTPATSVVFRPDPN